MEYVLDLQTMEAPDFVEDGLANSVRSCQCCVSTLSIVLCS